MTLYINELSFNNAKVVNSSDAIAIQTTPIHGSNFPDVQTIGVQDPSVEIEITVANIAVNQTLAQLRGSIRNRDFSIIRSDTQSLRDNKNIIFVKVKSIAPVRDPGWVNHARIRIQGVYVGTQQSHQPNYYVNSVQVDNDWQKAGRTALGLPVGASLIDQVVSGTVGGHSYIVTPLWASGVDSNDGAYSTGTVPRGTVGFNLDFTNMYSGMLRVYDNNYVSGNHLTDTDDSINMASGYMTVQQEGWLQTEFNKNSGYVIVRSWTGSAWNEVMKLYPNSGQGFGSVYLLALSDHYIRLGLDTQDEFEFYLCKIPGIIPATGMPFYFTGTTLVSGTVSGNAGANNFVNVTTGSSGSAWIGSNRYFTITTTSGRNVVKSLTSGASGFTCWVGWETGTVTMAPRYLDVLRRLE